MSLKHDIEKHPWAFSKELLEAVEDYKSGKRNAKRKLRKIVNRDNKSEHFYNELIERYADLHRQNKEKNKRKLCLFGYTIEEWLPVLEFFSVIGAISAVVYAIGEPNILTGISMAYLLISFFVYHHSNTEKKLETAELKKKIKQLEKELEEAYADLQQE